VKGHHQHGEIEEGAEDAEREDEVEVLNEAALLQAVPVVCVFVERWWWWWWWLWW
jgi:hypothetical protein